MFPGAGGDFCIPMELDVLLEEIAVEGEEVDMQHDIVVVVQRERGHMPL